MIIDFSKNLGAIDRIIRVTIGVLLLILVITGYVIGWWAIGLTVLGISQFIEAYFLY